MADYTRCGAQLSPCGRYRWKLWRGWADAARACFVMLNPSTAGELADDPTIRKCVGFAKRWDLGGIVVVNLFAFRATDPRELVRARAAGIDIHGPLNHVAIAEAARESERIVLDWGAGLPRGYASRPHAVIATINNAAPHVPVTCLGRTRDGQPRHPLMLAYDTQLEPFDGQAAALPPERGTP